MFEQEINQAIQRISREVLADRIVLTLPEIMESERMPERYKPFFETEARWWVYSDAESRAFNRRFDFSHPELASIVTYLENVQVKHARFEREDFLATLDSAVKLTFNYLCRPQTTLKWYLFRGEPTKPISEVMLRLEAFSDYRYFHTVLSDWVQRKQGERGQFESISAREFERIVRRIDDQILLSCTIDDLLDVLDPLFDHVGVDDEARVPIEALIVFFDDKNIKKLVDRLEGERTKHPRLSRSEFAHLLDDLLSTSEEDPETDFSMVYQEDELDDVVRRHLEAVQRFEAPARTAEPEGYHDHRVDDDDAGRDDAGYDSIAHDNIAHDSAAHDAGGPENGSARERSHHHGRTPAPASPASGVAGYEAEETDAFGGVGSGIGRTEPREKDDAGIVASDADIGAEPAFEGEVEGVPSEDRRSPYGASASQHVAAVERYRRELEAAESRIESEETPTSSAAEETNMPGVDHEPVAAIDSSPSEEGATEHVAAEEIAPEETSEKTAREETVPAAEHIQDRDVRDDRVAKTASPEREESLADVREHIDAMLERKVVKKIFGKNRDEYNNLLDRINAATSWREASRLLDELFIKYDVDPYSRTAIRFTDSVYGRYLSSTSGR